MGHIILHHVPWRGRMEGSGEETRPRQYKYPAVEVVKRPIPPVFAVRQLLSFRLSRLATIWSFYLHLAGESQKYKVRAGETHAEGVTQTGGITDFIGATAGTIC